ncbi:hypothetical protein [Breoghania sp. L-A4]|uniref:hypothetical protein n=1 Tax=Breoghania sp. L-A4 TaxID=2304600 RepID=UPI0013C37B26|nr:hypothetical protein [Breoghania sp. L-A4]
MNSIIEKIIDILISEKLESVKIPVVLSVLGALVIFLSDRLPEHVADKGTINLIGTLILFIGIALIIIAFIDKAFGISILSGLADGTISGLVASFSVAAASFAPVGYFDEENFFFYRVFISIVYGMLYGGLVGVFVLFFKKDSRVNLLRYTSLIVLLYILIIYFSSNYVFHSIPIVNSRPIMLGEIFMMHVLYIPLFLALHNKSVSQLKDKTFLISFSLSTIILLVLLNTVKLKIIFGDINIQDPEIRIWNMEFYADWTPSLYSFCFFMVIFILYASINIITSLLKYYPENQTISE